MNSIKKLADIQCLINEAYSDKEPLTEEQKASKKVFNEYCEDIRKDLEALNIVSILMSIKPRWVAKILNGEKTIEVRKKFPKDFVGWVYIYCTKAKPYICKDDDNIIYEWKEKTDDMLNGKLVARFWCDKVEEIKLGRYSEGEDYVDMFETSSMYNYSLVEKSCVSEQAMERYLTDEKGYAIHISNLEIFDEPKELEGRAPQSWMYFSM